MNYATDEEIEKLKYHKEEINKIKKSQNYKNLMVASKNPATNKQLERYKLNIKRHQSNIETINANIRIRTPRRVRNIKPKYSNYPENPAKKRDMEQRQPTIINKNNHKIVRIDKVNPIQSPIETEEIDYSFIM